MLPFKHEGRVGPKVTKLRHVVEDYDVATQCYRIRVDCGNNLEFWCSLPVTQTELDEVKARAEEEASSGDESVPNKKPRGGGHDELLKFLEKHRQTWIDQGLGAMWVGIAEGCEPIFEHSEDLIREALKTGPAVFDKVGRDRPVINVFY